MEDLNFDGDSGYADSDSLSPLRPIKYRHEHISKLQVFSDDLQKAIQTSFPRAAHPYVAVTVLLLRWTDDDLNIQVELDRLRDVFESQFRFATEQWNIPSKNPTRALQAKLYDFQESHQLGSELLIVYYGGHGEASRTGKSVWAARWRRAKEIMAQLSAISPIECWLNSRRTRRPDSPTLAWSSLQPLLENAIPHVLIILDCCFAANAARDTAEGSTKEILAACGRENPTTGVGLRSFTSALIDELHAFGSDPFTVAMLHSRLVTMRWRLQYTPIYALLSEHGGNSIHFAPLPKPKLLEPQASLHGPGVYAVGDDPMDPSSNDESLFNASGQQSSQSSVSAGSETRVLLAISIRQDAVRDVSQWVTWLTTQAPWDVTKVQVQVEGAYESHSTLVLVSIPIYAWDGLPDKVPYRFIAFVKSSNLQQSRKDFEFLFPSAVSRQETTKKFGSSMVKPEIALEKSHDITTRPDKHETAVTEDNTEVNIVSGSPTTASVHPGAKVEKKSYNALQRDLTPNGDRNVSPALVGSSIGGVLSRDSRATKSKARSPNRLNSWIANSGPSQPVKKHIAGRRIAKSGARLRNHRSQPYPPIGTSAILSSSIFLSGSRSGDPWSAKEDEQLIQARRLGMNWGPIARDFFPTKGANACRKRHERLMDKLSISEQWAPSKTEQMARLYHDLREQMWSLLASRLGESWKTVEAKCMEKGVKTLQATARRRHNMIDIKEWSDNSRPNDTSSDDTSSDESCFDSSFAENSWANSSCFDDSGTGFDPDREQQLKFVEPWQPLSLSDVLIPEVPRSSSPQGGRVGLLGSRS